MLPFRKYCILKVNKENSEEGIKKVINKGLIYFPYGIWIKFYYFSKNWILNTYDLYIPETRSSVYHS